LRIENSNRAFTNQYIWIQSKWKTTEDKFANQKSAYFVSFASVNWVDLITREFYLSNLAESLTYYRKHKGIKLYAYVFMPNHVHLLFGSLKK